eukprot:12498958-Prorocentrum_lima.AAC.1
MAHLGGAIFAVIGRAPNGVPTSGGRCSYDFADDDSVLREYQGADQCSWIAVEFGAADSERPLDA